MSEATAAARRSYSLYAGSAYDPAAAGGLVAWQRPGGTALLRRGESTTALRGSHPALGGARIAWREGDRVTIADAATLGRLGRQDAPGADVLALSDAALVWRTRDADGTDRLWFGDRQLVLESPAPTEIGRPALAGTLLLCHLAGPLGSRILAIDLTTGVQQVLRADPGAQITNPSTDGSRLLYVHATGQTQQLRVGPLAPGDPAADATLLVHASPGRRDREREPGRHRHRAGYPGRKHPPLPPRSAPGVVATLWSTALMPGAAFVTRLRVVRGQGRTADILTVPA
jgi:hypothetical protein